MNDNELEDEEASNTLAIFRYMKLFKLSYLQTMAEPADVVFTSLQIQSMLDTRRDKEYKKATRKNGRR